MSERKEKCTECRYFSGLIKRLDPILWGFHNEMMQMITRTGIDGGYDRDDEYQKCYKQGGVCMRYPMPEGKRPIIWDGDDWCGEWASQVEPVKYDITIKD